LSVTLKNGNGEGFWEKQRENSFSKEKRDINLFLFLPKKGNKPPQLGNFYFCN